MKNLLYKELRLAFNPLYILFLLLPAMVLIPNYPYLVGFIYIPISFIYIFNGGRENNEMYYTCLLPVKKTDIVKSRFISIVIYEALAVIIAIPFIYINGIMGMHNAAGCQANWALLGEVFLMFGSFNIIFLTKFYMTGIKTGIPFLWASLVSVILAEVVDIMMVTVPFLKENVNVSIFASQTGQLITFFIGLAIYALFTLISYGISRKEIQKVEL